MSTILNAFPIWLNISPVVNKEMEILERKVLRLCIGKLQIQRRTTFKISEENSSS